jgi:hypothetical protein
MGDRANIRVKQIYANAEGEAEFVWLYTHWGGYDLAKTLRAALARHERWSDESYLTRIIAREMGMGQDGESGFGISTYQGDNEHPIITVLPDSQTVVIDSNSWTFEKFANLSDAAIEKAYR